MISQSPPHIILLLRPSPENYTKSLSLESPDCPTLDLPIAQFDLHEKGFDSFLVFQCLTICCTNTGQPCCSVPGEEMNRIKPFRASPNNTRLTFACSNMSDGKIEQFDVIRERILTVSTNDLVT